MKSVDIVIVGGGMAGASLGAALATHASVVILEMEQAPGYHATGRSVAFWQESYGGPAVQPLTTASGPMLANPPADLSDHGFLNPRGTVHIGRASTATRSLAMQADFGGIVDLHTVDPATIVPCLRPGWNVGLLEPSCCDIDATGLHQAYLARFRRSGGTVRTGVTLLSARHDGGTWHLAASDGAMQCRILVNAAGAWADPVARACDIRPIGITPYRRTVVQLRVPTLPSPDLPIVMDLEQGFYFKPQGAGRVWLTPHDEVPSPPCDAAPEEMAVAQAMDRFARVVDWPVEAVERKWAGLRSFAPDRAPVYGFDPDQPAFYWFAGQGGFGIQTAPAAAALAAGQIGGGQASSAIASIDPRAYAPERFR